MKCVYAIFALFLAGGAVTAARAQLVSPVSQQTVVFVDFEQVFTNFYKTKLANDQLMELSESINREQTRLMMHYDTLREEFKMLRDQLLKEDLDDDEKKRVRGTLTATLTELNRTEERVSAFNENQQERWKKQNQRLRLELIRDLREKLAEYGRAKGYIAILDSSISDPEQAPSTLYFDKDRDVTGDVIRYVNRP